MEKSRLMLGLKLVASIVLCQFVGLVGSIFTTPQVGNWYAFLTKPAFAPPNWIFAPVWTFLFLTMGVSLFLILINNDHKKDSSQALAWFVIQLVLNMAWSAVFFTLHSPLGGIFVIVALFIAILMTILKSLKISEPAGILLLPYLLWVGFASILNIAIFILNK